VAEGLPDKREVERTLRATGLSARQAKRLLSGGWRALDPNAPPDGDADALLAKLEALATRLRESKDAV
jgi:hypothetical protein